MNGFLRRPLATVIGCLFAGQIFPIVTSALATEQVGTATPETTLKLRQENEIRPRSAETLVSPERLGISPPIRLDKKERAPTFLTANDIQGRADDVTEATGNVELRRAGQTLYADQLTYYPLDDEVDAKGNVRLTQAGAELDTPHLRMRLSEQIGFTEEARYRLSREIVSKVYGNQQIVVRNDSAQTLTNAPMMLNVPDSYGLPTREAGVRNIEAVGAAQRINFEGENHIRLEQATYSTCRPGSTDWYLKGKEISLDYDLNAGEASEVSLWFQNLPLLYSPWASFSLQNQRKSGFLHPSFGSSTRTGLDLSIPYYWNIAPNYDATFHPRVMSKRGFQLGSEIRYLDYHYTGKLNLEYLPEDQQTGESRHAVQLQHQQNLGRGFSAAINYNRVSDDLYWQDLTSKLMQTSQSTLPQQAILRYSPNHWWQASAQVLRYQTLQIDPNNRINSPYFIEPRVEMLGFKPDLFGIGDFTLAGQFTQFTHPDPMRFREGQRTILNPQFALPFVGSAFNITPKVGVHLTKYNMDANGGAVSTESFSRTVPTFSLDSSLAFERNTTLFDKDFIQTLEPRLYYVRIPYRDQSKLPVFDTAIADFNFAQIFSENRYSGYDRINDANQLTAAVTSRFIDASSGVELFKAMVGQRYYFSPQRVTLPGEVARIDDLSNIVAGATGLIAPKTYADTAWEYSYRTDQTMRFSAGARYQPDYGKVLSGSYRYTRDPLTGSSLIEQADIAAQWPISAQWYAVGRHNYSMRDRRPLETIAGVEYNAGCWSARFVAQRLEAIAGSPNTTFFFQLELHDLGSIGSNPLDLLRRSIPGYGKMNELPGSTSSNVFP